MASHARPPGRRRMLLVSGVIAALVLTGLVLFFLFRDTAQPLLGAASPLG